MKEANKTTGAPAEKTAKDSNTFSWLSSFLSELKGCPSKLKGYLSELPGTLYNEWKELTFLSKTLLIAIILMLIFAFITAFCKSHQWVFSVQAQTRVIELITPNNRETKWRINETIICSRGGLDLPPGQSSLILDNDKSCGRRWKGYRTTDPEQTLILRGAVHVVMESHQDHTLFLALRTYKLPAEESTTKSRDSKEKDNEPEMKPGARLSFNDGTPDIELGENGNLRINIIFPESSAAKKTLYTDRVFPFSGDTIIGRDVNWAGTSLLTEGSIQVYTADESPDKRKRVDETKLLLGDQLRLDHIVHDKKLIFPKGFVRFAPKKTYFDVIAFGAADRVRIERFGDNGYDFKPGRLSFLIHDQLFVLVASTFLALMALVTGVMGVCKKKKCQ